MRLAFVVRLGNDTRPDDGLFEGWVEEVDSCTELRFRSAEELLNFLGQRFALAMDSIRSLKSADNKEASAGQKLRREGKR